MRCNKENELKHSPRGHKLVKKVYYISAKTNIHKTLLNYQNHEFIFNSCKYCVKL